MMNKMRMPFNNETGSVLLIAMLVLIMITLIGIAATTTSSVEVQISGNEKFAKMAFHGADGGTETAISLIEENCSCPEGFADPPNSLYNPDFLDPDGAIVLGQVIIPDGNEAFYQNEAADYTRPTPGQRDSYFYYPGDTGAPPPNANQLHVNQTYNSAVQLGEGAGAGQNTGYDGLGRSAAAGGGERIYDLPAQRMGLADCETCVRIQWVHKIGLEGTCTYN